MRKESFSLFLSVLPVRSPAFSNPFSSLDVRQRIILVCHATDTRCLTCVHQRNALKERSWQPRELLLQMWLTVAPASTRVLMGDVNPAVVESCMDGRCPDSEATELWSYLCTVFRLPLLFLSSLGVNSTVHKPYCDNCATQSGRKSFTSMLTWVCASRDESGVFF